MCNCDVHVTPKKQFTHAMTKMLRFGLICRVCNRTTHGNNYNMSATRNKSSAMVGERGRRKASGHRP